MLPSAKHDDGLAWLQLVKRYFRQCTRRRNSRRRCPCRSCKRSADEDRARSSSPRGRANRQVEIDHARLHAQPAVQHVDLQGSFVMRANPMTTEPSSRERAAGEGGPAPRGTICSSACTRARGAGAGAPQPLRWSRAARRAAAGCDIRAARRTRTCAVRSATRSCCVPQRSPRTARGEVDHFSFGSATIGERSNSTFVGLAVDLHDLAQVHVLHDVARVGVDVDRPARTVEVIPRTAAISLSGRGVAVGRVDRVVDRVHRVVR